MTDIGATLEFLDTHARLLDRRRAALALGIGDPDAVLHALTAYRGADGGYGSALEPDLRVPAGQPAGAAHALEVLAELSPVTTPEAASVCDWLEANSFPNGAVPFALAGAAGPGTAPLWSSQDPTEPSLQITAFAVAMAHGVARFDPAVAALPWLGRATGWCLEEIAATRECPFPLVLRYLLWVLDSLPAVDLPAGELERLVDFVPAGFTMPVPGGTEDEAIHPLDFSPRPGTALRALVDPAAIEADLDRLLAEGEEGGGWDVDWTSWSPAGALEWRGWATVRALRILIDHGRVAKP